jgi:hypothetical protein
VSSRASASANTPPTLRVKPSLANSRTNCTGTDNRSHKQSQSLSQSSTVIQSVLVSLSNKSLPLVNRFHVWLSHCDTTNASVSMLTPTTPGQVHVARTRHAGHAAPAASIIMSADLTASLHWVVSPSASFPQTCFWF